MREGANLNHQALEMWAMIPTREFIFRLLDFLVHLVIDTEPLTVTRVGTLSAKGPGVKMRLLI